MKQSDLENWLKVVTFISWSQRLSFSSKFLFSKEWEWKSNLDSIDVKGLIKKCNIGRARGAQDTHGYAWQVDGKKVRD